MFSSIFLVIKGSMTSLLSRYTHISDCVVNISLHHGVRVNWEQFETL